ncbi:diguanylate cyclase [Paraburkholderia sp. C35]|uniref:diguanylate cyclase domain-containing protein n=1 Tax=Paraburkholderia sp. C35 TaxID=2126993 RepID=UPI000D69DA16|nr:diguanylate cyclase [Paraburkholderia sp. C35]
MKTITRLYRFRIAGVLFASVAVLTVLASCGMAGLSRLDGYMNALYWGNMLPIARLNELRAAALDARREFWKATHFRDPARTAASLKVVKADTVRIDKAWSEYYPTGVSGTDEARLADELANNLPKFYAILTRAITLLEHGDYAAAARWVDDNIDYLNRFDSLLSQCIDTNTRQATELTHSSESTFRLMFLATFACIALCVMGAVGVSIWVLHQRNGALSESRYHSWLANRVFDLTLDGVMITDSAGNIERVNPAFTRVTGYTQEDVQGRNPRLLSSGRQSAEFYRAFWQSLKDAGHWHGEVWNRKKSGDIYLESLSIAGVQGRNGRYTHYVAILSDITQRHRHEEHLRNLATHDVLTGLPNRVLLDERLKHAISRARRTGTHIAVMFVDLDGFKAINDTLGHSVGDDVLKAVSERLAHGVRESDTVARLGGDEFVVILEDMRNVQQVEPVARALLDVVGRPIVIHGDTVGVTASIGISLYPDDADNAEQLLLHADRAMYVAKKMGKSDLRFARPIKPADDPASSGAFAC